VKDVNYIMASAEESLPVGSPEGFEVSKTEDSVVHGNDDDGTPPPGIITDANCLDDSVLNHDRREEGETEDVEGIQERVSSISLTSAQQCGPVRQSNSEETNSSDEFEDAKESLPPKALTEDWKNHPKHFFILSNAGKPIYSRHTGVDGDDDEHFAFLAGVIAGHVGFVDDMDDHIRAIHVNDSDSDGIGPSIVFLNKGPLILVAVSKGMETVTQLVVQLTYMYHQILSVVTLSQLTRIFEQRKNYDLRNMIRGSERLLDSLAGALDTDPSFMLAAVRVLELPAPVRDSISNTISSKCAKIKNIIFAILLLDNRLVALVRRKEYFIHPADLHLILNLVNSTEAFKHAESWTPVCLPKFNSSGFLHAHVSYLAENCNACLLMLTTERDIFFELSEAKHKIVAALEKSGATKSIMDSGQSCEYCPADLGFPEIRHFLYKSKTTAQFIGAKWGHPYLNDSPGQKRVHNLYLYAQSKTHSSGRNVKFLYHTASYETLAGWATHAFEIYAVFDPLISKSKAVSALSRLSKWAKKEENNLFILSAPTFN